MYLSYMGTTQVFSPYGRNNELGPLKISEISQKAKNKFIFLTIKIWESFTMHLSVNT